MTIKVTRRDLFTLAGGSAIGLALSPAPWRLIDDLSIWTQNWKWIPRPPKGPVSFKTTRCALCPSGCAMQARCIGDFPVSLRGATKSVVLCALGMTTHHLRYHPARLSSSVRIAGGVALPTSPNAITRALAEAIQAHTAKGRRIAVLDARPGRSSTSAWQRLLALVDGGTLVPAPGREGVSLTTFDRMLGVPAGSCAVDLAQARTILSFGAPLAEGWGSPATFADLALKRREQRLITVEPDRSRTAALAHQWIPARPGSEGALALALAHVLIDEGLVPSSAAARIGDFADFKNVVTLFTPELAALATGVPASTITSLARQLANGPTVVFAGEEPGSGRFGRATETAIFALNALLGSVDIAGGIVQRAPLPEMVDMPLAPSVEIEEIADGSIGVLIVDVSAGDFVCPRPVVSRKLASDALVVAFSPFLAGAATWAHYVIATPAPLESIQEPTGSPDMPRSSFAVSTPLQVPPAGARDPIAFLADLGAALRRSAPASSSEELMKLRAGAIFETQRGQVVAFDGTSQTLGEIESADSFWQAIKDGGMWIDDERTQQAATKISLTSGLTDQLRLLASPPGTTNARRQLSVIARAPRDVSAAGVVSPILTKLYQESGLRRAAFSAAMNPRTIAELSLRAGVVQLETAAGRATVTVVADDAVRPGVVEIAIGPGARAIGQSAPVTPDGPLDVLPADDAGVWRYAAASVVEG